MLDASTGRNPPAPGSFVPGPHHNAPPPLDLARSLHVQAFAALIDRRLAGADSIGLAAPRLLVQLVDIGTATLDTPHPGAPAMSRLTMFGISATGDTAHTLLRNWQGEALTRVALGPATPTIRGPFA